MKSQKGITLVSLVIYIIVMTLMLAALSTISLNFYKNTKALDEDTADLIEYNNFNYYFIKEIKTVNNKIDNISEDGSYILFSSGNSFILKNNSIYYNDIEISKNVKEARFAYEKDENENDILSIINVSITYEKYAKEMKYKLEEIY